MIQDALAYVRRVAGTYPKLIFVAIGLVAIGPLATSITLNVFPILGGLWTSTFLWAALFQAYRYRNRAIKQDKVIYALSRKQLSESIKQISDSYAKQNFEGRAIAEGRAIVFFGDSNIARWDLFSTFPGSPFINRGIGGDTTRGMQSRIEKDVLALNARGVVILGGINDLILDNDLILESPRSIAHNLLTLAEVSLRANVQPYICTLLPTGLASRALQDPMYSRRSIVQSVNDEIRHLVLQRSGIELLDVYRELENGAGAFKAGLTDDGLHPNENGFTVMSKLVRIALEHSIVLRK
jgi:lysophospholipase L1-like esterase